MGSLQQEPERSSSGLLAIERAIERKTENINCREALRKRVIKAISIEYRLKDHHSIQIEAPNRCKSSDSISKNVAIATGALDWRMIRLAAFLAAFEAKKTGATMHMIVSAGEHPGILQLSTADSLNAVIKLVMGRCYLQATANITAATAAQLHLFLGVLQAKIRVSGRENVSAE